MRIAEHFLLIALDPTRGLPRWPPRRHDTARLVAAALVLELTVQDRLTLRAGRLHVDSSLPTRHPLLNDALRVLAAEDLPAPLALRQLVRGLAPLPTRVLEGLYRRDLVHRIIQYDWLLRRRVRYPLRSVQARNEALCRLRSVPDDLRTFALILLADACGLLAAELEAHLHETGVRRLLALATPTATEPPALRLYAALREALLDESGSRLTA
jgi:hypothetical protein